MIAFSIEFERLKAASKQKESQKITMKDLCKQRSSLFGQGCISEYLKLKLSSFSGDREALKGLSNGIILASLVHLSASLVIVTYSVVIFDKIGATHIDPYISTISIGVMQIVGCLCTTTFSDSLGRKALLIISLLGSSFGLMLFSLYSYLKQNGYAITAFEFVPVMSLSFVIFISSAGILPLIFVCIVENLPSKVRLFAWFDFILYFRFHKWKIFFSDLDSDRWLDNMQRILEFSLIYLLEAISSLWTS